MHFYKSPLINKNSIENTFLFDSLIKKTQKLNIIGNTKEEKLDLLFWKMELGLNKIYLAFESPTQEVLETPIIKKLIMAMKSRYKGKYLRASSIMPF